MLTLAVFYWRKQKPSLGLIIIVSECVIFISRLIFKIFYEGDKYQPHFAYGEEKHKVVK